MMMACIYRMVSERQHFTPDYYEELTDPHYQNPKVVLNDVKVFVYLEAQGYDTSLLVKCNDN